jgi:hypothetical protein
MKMRKLLDRWQSLSRSPEPRVSLELALRQHDAARVYALAEMYPGLAVADILGDVIHSALDELQEAFPYVNGDLQVAEDEMGNPVYEDAGPTPTFLALTQKHMDALESSKRE